MKSKRYLYLVLILLALMISISAVSAADDSASELIGANDDNGFILDESINDDALNDNDDKAVLEEADEPVLDSADEKTVLGEEEPRKFEQLDEAINGNTDEEIELTCNYAYQSGDDKYIDGIKINRTVTIDGKGHTIDGSHIARIFNVTGNDVVIKNINFINGNASSENNENDFGGAINWYGNNGKVIDSNFTGNTALWGGAIIWDGENGTVNNSNFTTNFAPNGGAIRWRGENGTVNNSNFNNNNAVDCGAISWDGENGNLINSNFNNNYAGDLCGAIGWDTNGVNGVISNCNFTNNEAFNWGGAIIWDGENGTVNNSNFNNNIANIAGAIYWNSENGTVNNSNFTGNNATQRGGAIEWHMNNGKVSSSNFTNNTADEGGAIYFFCSFETKVNNNLFLNNHNTFYNYESGLNLDYNWFGNNATNYDETPNDIGNVELDNWLFLNATTDPYITFKLYSYDGTEVNEYDNDLLPAVNLTISSNKGSFKENVEFGEEVTHEPLNNGIYSVTASIENAEYTIDAFITDGTTFWDLNKTINDNDASEITLNKSYKYDSAIDEAFIYGIVINRTLTLNGNNNTIDGSNSARIFNVTGNNVVIKNINFINGNASGDNYEETLGGAIYWTGENGKVIDSNFNNNTATLFGGAICWNATNGTVSNSNFNNNKAGDSAAIVWFGSRGTVSNSNFTGNNATDNAGAIGWHGTNGNVKNSNFIDNNAHWAGAIYWSKEEGNIKNSNFTGNKAESWGGAIALQADNCIISHSIFNGNTADFASAIKLFSKEGSKINNNIFLNHNNVVIHSDYPNLDIDYNWFGNNATNYDEIENIANIELDNWLFLNATTDPYITFKLYSYDGTDVNEYDNDLLPTVNLTISSNKGSFKENVEFGEEVTHEPLNNGIYSVTASLENAEYTIDAFITDGTTFWDLNKTINDNDASEITLNHSYTYNPSTDSNFEQGIIIERPLTINGNGAILDANHSTRIFYLASNQINISNITFLNGNASGGGAIEGFASNSNISSCSFINNYANEGGAIELMGDGNSITSCIFVNNTANEGSVFYNANFFFAESNLIFNNNILLNNTAGEIYFYIADDTSNLDYNWFGNNATNYNEKPNIGNVELNNWLFLNATADPSPMELLSTSNIKFKLYLYDSSGVSEYDNTLLPIINLTLSSTEGDLDKRIAGLDEKIAYTANALGTGTITAKIENVEQTLGIDIKIKTSLSASAVTTTYNVGKNLVITLKDSDGKGISDATVTVNLGSNKKYTTDKNGQVKIAIGKLVPKTYTTKISFAGDDTYFASQTTAKVTVKKATPKITAKAKTFKFEDKTKKYTITLKNNKGAVMKNTKVTLKVNGKTYTAKTNSKGVATFKLTKLTKKGKYNAVITYAGNKYYKKATKKAKITVKAPAWKTVAKGSKDKATVKKIQKALKNNGYYLTYKGRYLKIDGKYNSCTVRSVKQFQKAKGLKVTGKVDYTTAKKLKIVS